MVVITVAVIPGSAAQRLRAAEQRQQKYSINNNFRPCRSVDYELSLHVTARARQSQASRSRPTMLLKLREKSKAIIEVDTLQMREGKSGETAIATMADRQPRALNPDQELRANSCPRNNTLFAPHRTTESGRRSSSRAKGGRWYSSRRRGPGPTKGRDCHQEGSDYRQRRPGVASPRLLKEGDQAQAV